MQTPPPLPNKRSPVWWSRNWKWFAPVIGVATILLASAFVVSVFSVMRSSEAYSGAVARAKAAPAVIDALGIPIQEGFFFTGNINVTGESGKAELTIPVEGPKGKAALQIEASKARGEWHFDYLVVKVDQTGQKIDLSESSHGSTPPPELPPPSGHSSP
jgi:hypothetical protein